MGLRLSQIAKAMTALSVQTFQSRGLGQFGRGTVFDPVDSLRNVRPEPWRWSLRLYTGMLVIVSGNQLLEPIGEAVTSPGETVALKDGALVLLRLFSSGDKEALVSFYASLSSETLRWSLPPYDRARVERIISDLANTIVLLALHDNRIVGHLQVYQYPFTRAKGIGELFVYLHQSFQNRGLGTLMMKMGIEEARKRRFHRLGLSVIADNKGAVKVYEKVGFLHEGLRREDYLGEDGRYHDVVEMGLIL